MTDERSKDDRSETPVDEDARPPMVGRQPQRPGQRGKYQPHPGERDLDTIPSSDPDGE